MDQGISIEAMILLAGFAVIVASAAWHRVRLDSEILELPQDVRDRLGWSHPGGSTYKRHRRHIANRLMLRGLPSWVPLSEQGRRHLMWLRVMGLGSAVYIAVVPTLVAGAWVLLLFLGVPIVVILAVYSWLVGPWPGER
jgi:hypothetical protein